ncbi:hypothetical protein SARC_03064 [Sphaeroforma arctica JP610]|uniref:FAM192A/Fyv6 N-terminal domain-containing protein n=1 Tax=Sphaeroforma arctica JP610 TaxID=667725 RepID=A0A0L0G904_9EUKA|nr:hypothetical protein SARC_03064 [Sphaeroforma arctica JP610]KNC84723.1 hypothetical protein SARC_03064 [Sphaeroforma arctica JP610]|eukprot:XP_014158625.1 hypothetical protein SARC_03064 [Sphaeroforma arctica JP610]
MSKFVASGEIVQDVFTDNAEERAAAKQKEWDDARARAALAPLKEDLYIDRLGSDVARFTNTLVLSITAVKHVDEDYDPRSLFERLQENKDRKNEDIDEKMKFKNQISYLDDEDVNFLQAAAEEEAKKEEQRWEEEMADVKAYRMAVSSKQTAQATNFNLEKLGAEGASKESKVVQPPKKRFAGGLLLGIVKRPADSRDANSSSESKRQKVSDTTEVSDTHKTTKADPPKTDSKPLASMLAAYDSESESGDNSE